VNKLKKNQKILFIITDLIILFLPVFFIIGAPATNFATLILSLCFLYYCSKNNQWNLFKDKWVIFFLLFWIYNILNSLFADDVLNALRASFFYIRFLLFSLAIIYIGLNFIKIKKILFFWTIILIFVAIDINYQYKFGADLFGYYSYLYLPRLSGPFGDELVAGAYLSRFLPFLLIFILFFKNNLKLEIFLFLLSIYYLFIVMLTGERSALIFSLSYSTLFIFYIFRKDFKKILLLCLAILILLIVSVQNTNINKRYSDLLKIVSDFEKSSYGKLYYSGYRIWKNHKINGVGLKNFRVNCDEELVDLINSSHPLCSSHPHNLYLELLSETGIIGTTLFLLIFYYIFKQIYLDKIKKRKFTNFQAANLFAIILIIWPIITSGSFYTSWGGLFLWIYIGFLFNDKIKQNSL
tara:strand:+ start:1283 stop:2509 length:1227 start_codon:yes stop_codon:yes gene_type:complete